MAYCNKCGQEVGRDDSFCEECGAELATSADTTETPDATATPHQSGSHSSGTGTGIASIPYLGAAPGSYPGKNRELAALLAFFTGWLGGHHFYLGNTKQGVVYLVLSWTLIPMLLSIIEVIIYAASPELFIADAPTSSQTTTGTSTATAQATDDPAPDPDRFTDAEFYVEGVNGGVALYSNRIVINRSDTSFFHKMQHGFSGDKEIPLSSITSVQVRKPSTVTRGYIQFGQSGFSESDGGLVDATDDENTVMFEKESLSAFQELRSKVREYSNEEVTTTTDSSGGGDEALTRLRERYAEGEVDEEEYERRQEVLEVE